MTEANTHKPTKRTDEWHYLSNIAKRLSWFSLIYLTIEGSVGVIAGLIAHSTALLGFGIDSAIEGIASIIIIWRFTGSRTLSVTSEHKAQKAVAVSFFLLAPYIAYEATRSLVNGEHPLTSVVGIALTVSSVLIMPVLGIWKQRIGRRLSSEATEGEGKQNLICAYLAIAVLVGLLGNTLLHWWWLDPVIALGIAVLAVREGIEAWRGEE